MSYRRTPAVQARLDRQRDRIVAATAAQLAEQGYAACAVAAVAARAEVAAGTVYRHFDSKAHLVAEVFQGVASGEVEAVRRAVAAEPDLAGRLRALIETFAGRAMKAPRLAYAMLAEPVDPPIEELRLQYRLAFRDVVAGIVADAVASGRIPPQDPAVVAAATIGAIGEALVGPLAVGREDPETVPTLIAFAHRALGVAERE